MPAATTLFCLHALGGSARAWDAVAAGLGDGVRCVAIDLPGFGDAAQRDGFGVADMADAVAAAIRRERPRSWALAGHSMGAKVAAVVARRAEDGAEGLDGLARIVLLAGSPPAPEPMEDEQRQTMLGWFAGDEARSRTEAETFVAQNVSGPLSPAVHGHVVGDLLRANPAAWRAWLTSGSNEDWSDRVGILRTPTLILVGADDAALGLEAQRSLNAPHYAAVRVTTVANAKHLLPLERPAEIAALISEHLA